MHPFAKKSWKVLDEPHCDLPTPIGRATVALIKGAFAELNADPKLGRAEALRRSILDPIEW